MTSFRYILQHLPSFPFWELDLNNQDALWSAELCRLVGAPLDNQVGFDSFQQYVVEEDWPHFKATIDGLIENGGIQDICFRMKTDHGAPRSFRNRAFLLKDDNNNLNSLVGFIQETTQAEAPYTDSQVWFEALTQQSTMGITVADVEGKYTFVNAAFCKMMGYSEHELLQMTVFDMKAPEQDHSSFERSKTSEEGHGIEVLLQRKDGSTFVSEVVGKMIEVNGQTQVLGTIRDISEQVEAKIALKNSETRLRSLFDLSPVGIALNDFDSGAFLEVNEALLAPTGYSLDEFMSLSYWDLTPEYYQSQEESQLENLKTRGYYGPYEKEYIKKNGEHYPVQLRGVVAEDSSGKKLIWSIVEDISERKATEQKLSYQATHDSLTGLINRLEFERKVNKLLSRHTENANEHVLCFMDLDQFKVINDTCGHTAGDELLRQLGLLLKKSVRQQDTLARLGGDEFGLMMECCTLEQANRTTEMLRQQVQDYPFNWEGKCYRLGLSIGVVAINSAMSDFTELMKKADAACYMAKDRGRNRVHVFHPDDAEMAQRQGEMQWVTKINSALKANRFCLYAQPIVSLENSEIIHYEFLIRMIDEEENTVPPGAFLPAAERYNLIEHIDIWVIDHVFSYMAQHRDSFEKVEFVSINLSGASLANAQLLPNISELMNKWSIDPTKLCFEVTETAAISNLNSAVSLITALKELGCRFALDDFGSGLSSFGYLKNLPVDYLKIDGMFVKDIVDDPIDHAMVTAINNIGQVMKMKTIAEFVENDEIKAMLKVIGVDFVQGFGVGKPQPVESLFQS